MRIEDRSKERLGKVYPLFVSWEPLPDGKLKGTPVGIANCEMFLDALIEPGANLDGGPCTVLKVNAFSKKQGQLIWTQVVFGSNPPLHETLWIASESVLRLATTLWGIVEKHGCEPLFISTQQVQDAINGSLNDDED